MCKKCCINDGEIPVGEIRQQLEYARITGGELFNLFAHKKTEKDILACEIPVIQTKLSMLLDFLFQANLWCDVLDEDYSIK